MMTRHSHHHNSGKSSSNIKNLYRLILWASIDQFLITRMKMDKLSLRPISTRRTVTTQAHTIKMETYLNNFQALINHHH